MPTILTNGIQLPDKGSVDWYGSMQSNYNLIDTHLGNTDTHVTAEDKANWNSKQGSLSQAQLDAIAQVSTNTSDIATLQSGKANALHTHSSSDITDIGDYATKQYVDNSISGLVDNAPDALNTLNELSAALNDDANFASTVTTALGAKANSADLATVATSGSYNDLSNKPSIPTKTSDLTNDSNFVDTSNSAVASGITSAKVTSYDAHIADTDIHVTTADKSKWNDGVSQSYVLRYSSSSVTDNSTIAFSTLDNTDNIKSGDKVIDVDGKIFSIVSVDTANQTVTVGSALVDLALDANVVHTSGNETITGTKTLDNVDLPFKNSAELGVSGGSTNITFSDKNGQRLCALKAITYSSGVPSFNLTLTQKVDNTIYTTNGIALYQQANSKVILVRPTLANDNADGLKVELGSSANRYNRIYGLAYYYGNDNIEFSTKFVTTDTEQTISGAKTFSSNVNVYNSDSTTDTANIILKNSKAEVGTEFSEQSINFVDKNNNPLAKISCYGSSGNYTRLYITASDSNNNSDGFFIRKSTTGTLVLPTTASAVALGNTTFPYYNVQSSRFNGLTPSSLGMPVIDRTKYIDISSYFTNTATGEYNSYSVPANGWIFLRLDTISSCQASVLDSDSNLLYGTTTTGSVEQVLLPVIAGTTFQTQWATGSAVVVATAKFIPCQGNV